MKNSLSECVPAVQALIFITCTHFTSGTVLIGEETEMCVKLPLLSLSQTMFILKTQKILKKVERENKNRGKCFGKIFKRKFEMVFSFFKHGKIKFILIYFSRNNGRLSLGNSQICFEVLTAQRYINLDCYFIPVQLAFPLF